MRSESKRGNRTVGWFAGAKMMRRIADGNPRRFLQLMNDLFEAARTVELTPKNQHRIAFDFCMRRHEGIAGLPEWGIFLKRIVDIVGNMLHDRVHGVHMVGAGYNFSVQPVLLDNPSIRKSLELGVAYSILFTDDSSVCDGLHPGSEFRLANMLAVVFWLPMRRAESAMLRSRHTKEAFAQVLGATAPATDKESTRLFAELQFELVEVPNE